MDDQFDLAFDWDGTLTSGDGQIGQDNGAQIDLRPLCIARDAGLSCAIMTCNMVEYVAGILEKLNIPAFPDHGFLHKVPHADFDRKVLVTGRKVLARFYVDDRALHYQFGDDPRIPLNMMLSLPVTSRGLTSVTP